MCILFDLGPCIVGLLVCQDNDIHAHAPLQILLNFVPFRSKILFATFTGDTVQRVHPVQICTSCIVIVLVFVHSMAMA